MSWWLAVLAMPVAVWGFRFLRLRRSIGSTRAYWETHRGDKGGLLYVALGDSAAQGVGASHPERGYVGLLAERLRQDTGGPVEVVNLSRSGARVGDVLTTQLPQLALLGRVPDLITVDVGGNDIRRYRPAAFAAEVEALCQALPAGTLVGDVPYFMHGSWERHAREAAAVLARRARLHGLDVVPLHEALRRQGWMAMLTQYAADWFHPNDRGHQVWADTYRAVLERRQQGI